MYDQSLPHHAKAPSPCNRSGFTLIEMLVVLLIVGIFSTVAVSRFTSFNVRHRLDAAVRRVQNDLQYASRQARFTSSSKTITFDIANERYDISGVPDIDHPGQVYGVDLRAPPYGAEIVSADFGGDAIVVFDGFGQPDYGGSVMIQVGNNQETVTLVGPTLPVNSPGLPVGQ